MNSAASSNLQAHELRLSSDVFRLDSIKKVAYRFSGRCSFDFQIDGTTVICKFLFARPQTEDNLAVFELNFRNELLDQDLRERIAEETAPLRNAILAYAFSNSGLQASDEV